MSVFWVAFCSDVDEKSTILGARGALAPVWGRVPKVVSKKNHFGTRSLTLLGVLFRAFRHFLTFDFSFIFGMTADTELWALWRRKGAQKEVFG